MTDPVLREYQIKLTRAKIQLKKYKKLIKERKKELRNMPSKERLEDDKKRAYQKAYHSRPDVIAKKYEYHQKYRLDPKNLAKEKIYNAERRAAILAEMKKLGA